MILFSIKEINTRSIRSLLSFLFEMESIGHRVITVFNYMQYDQFYCALGFLVHVVVFRKIAPKRNG